MEHYGVETFEAVVERQLHTFIFEDAAYVLDVVRQKRPWRPARKM